MKADEERPDKDDRSNSRQRFKPDRLTDEQLQELGKTAEKEREALLAERPELQAFQNKIDQLMLKAGSFEKRMAVLGMMMEANLKELQTQLADLSRKTEQWKKTVGQ